MFWDGPSLIFLSFAFNILAIDLLVSGILDGPDQWTRRLIVYCLVVHTGAVSTPGLIRRALGIGVGSQLGISGIR